MNAKNKLNLAYSLIAGFFACLVSLLIKFALNIDNLILSNNRYLKSTLQIGLGIFSFLCNFFMWLFFSKSLKTSSTSLYSTSLNKFSNFIFSAIFGYFILNESFDIFRWLIGLIILLIGIIILGNQN